MAMSDDAFLKRLSRFTPADQLDRDALLFAAGKASARPNRRWQALAAMLGAAQMITLALLLWPNSPPPNAAPHVPPPIAQVQPSAPAAEPSPTPQPPVLLVLRDEAIDTEGRLPLPAATQSLTSSEETPLRAFGALSADLLE